MSTTNPKKRELTDFFSPASPKRARTCPPPFESERLHTDHPHDSYTTFPVPYLPAFISKELSEAPSTESKRINDQADLDILYFQPSVSKAIANDLFQFIRRQLFFYRVQYKIKRGGIETQINTPRYTTVFGLDETSNSNLMAQFSRRQLRNPITEVFTESSYYNFCLVDYYANAEDSISYHSDDERFLGSDPAIASFSLGAKRDFLPKHKPVPPKENDPVVNSIKSTKPLKLHLASGDMILMRGRTQANWLHSIPKRKGGDSHQGRINITFRKAMVKGGTENYYQYNVGKGAVWMWDDAKREMMPWQADVKN